MDREVRENELLPALKVGYLLDKFSNIEDNSITLYKNLTNTLKLVLYAEFNAEDRIKYSPVAYVQSDIKIDNPLEPNADDRAKEQLFAEQYAIINGLEKIIINCIKKKGK